MKLLFNAQDDNHMGAILKELKSTISVKIAVAFLKNSGFVLLKPAIEKALKRGVHFEFYCGLNFGTTEAAALQNALELFEKYSNAKLYMIYTKSNQTFHPKLWVFQHHTNTTIIAGSANFTSGGLDKNFECSFIANFNNQNVQVKNVLAYFEDLKIKKLARVADSLMIAQYGKYQKEQAEKQKGLKATPPTPEEVNYDFAKLKKWHDKLKNQFATFNLKRTKDYRKGLNVLEIIAAGNLSKSGFIEQYEKLVGGTGIRAIWKSGSLDRHKGEIFENKSSFSKLVKFISDNRNADAAFVYNQAKKLADTIPGVGPNIVGEIMMTYNPKEFANINKNPISVLLKEAKVDIKKSSTSYSGEDYKTYCNIIKVIRRDLRLNDMLEVDTFFNEIYQVIKNKLKK